ncbi:hypothetical protein SFRURICE_020244 [Spodoptera frugiperda]|uniref:U6 snRNA-associated Sm-like protein LSm8 n=1 Tax=Spodoptera frugiperda TaxID=7108 RepID=A0A2H1W087_SPOFR|nr:hypothetical protein SFRURICE_020244 [Spodoptera frugiperda]
MASGLENYVNQTVSVITSDGRNFIGTLKGFDQTINIILDESHERVFSSSSGVAQVVLGLHIIRGDNVAIVGQIDESIDSRLDLGNIKAEPLGNKPITNCLTVTLATMPPIENQNFCHSGRKQMNQVPLLSRQLPIILFDPLCHASHHQCLMKDWL